MFFLILCRGKSPLNQHLGTIVWNFFQASFTSKSKFFPYLRISVFRGSCKKPSLLKGMALAFKGNTNKIPSLKIIYPLKMGAPWKRRFLLETIIFRGYVSFREGSCCWWKKVFQSYLGFESVFAWTPKLTQFEATLALFGVPNSHQASQKCDWRMATGRLGTRLTRLCK